MLLIFGDFGLNMTRVCIILSSANPVCHCSIIIMLWQSPHEQIENKRLIFDDVYRNQLEKEHLENNDQYFYYKTLGRIRDRFRIKSGSLGEGLFDVPHTN